MEVAVTSPLPGEALARLAGQHTVRVRDKSEPLDAEGLAELIGNADAAITLLSDPVTAQVLSACSNLKIVANYAVGYNNIDLDAARKQGIWVTNTPDVLTEATADLTLALLLAVTRRVIEGDTLVRTGGFSGWRPDFMLGEGLQGKTFGIIGFGRIGQAVARRVEAFGMKVLYTRRQRPRDARSNPHYRTLEQMLPECHVVSLHCPLTPETYYVLNERRLRMLPRGAYVINTARGPLLDEAALVRALDDGHLAGAGLDVYEEEPAVDPGLVTRRDVVLLPHVGSATVATRAAMADLAVANVEAVLAGRKPPTPVVTPEVPASP
jgi:glyoxylate reductase